MGTSSRFLFYHQGALGDFILALPALESLHVTFPEARFTVVASRNNLTLIASRPYLDKALSRDLSCFAMLFMDNPPDLSEVKKRLGFPFERAFIFGQSRLSILAQNISLLGVGKVYPVCSFPAENSGQQVTEFIYRQLSEQGLELPERKAVIEPQRTEKEIGSAFAGELLRRFEHIVILHPGSGSAKKIWPLVHWKALLVFFMKYKHIAKAVLCGPADEEVIEKLAIDEFPEDFCLIKQWQVSSLVGFLEKGSLFIGNDSGISHLSAALAVPTVVIFGHSDPRVWGPLGSNVTIVKEKWSYPENMSLPDKVTGRELPGHILHAIKSRGCFLMNT